MSNLHLHSQSAGGYTLLPNHFIDRYMPRANGEFVKVYLYLLRFLPVSGHSLGLSDIGDALACTETDVLRALRYWEKSGLLELSFDSRSQLSDITFLDLPAEAVSAGARPADADSEAPVPARTTLTASGKSGSAGSAPTDAFSAPSPKGGADAPPASLTPDKIKALREQEEVTQLLYIAEQYLQKTLSSTEAGKLLYFYDGLGFGAELVEYLIEYCVSHGHKSIRYMEKVALGWHSSGITTVAMAKDESSAYNKTYFGILKALGVTNRNPIPSEIRTMDRWLKEYGFSLELVLEACTRTVKATGKPSFQYADGILSSWNKKQVRTMEDVRALDLQHLQNQERQASKRAQASNRFNNFTQRDYNYSELEKQLLKQ